MLLKRRARSDPGRPSPPRPKSRTAPSARLKARVIFGRISRDTHLNQSRTRRQNRPVFDGRLREGLLCGRPPTHSSSGSSPGSGGRARSSRARRIRRRSSALGEQRDGLQRLDRLADLRAGSRRRERRGRAARPPAGCGSRARAQSRRDRRSPPARSSTRGGAPCDSAHLHTSAKMCPAAAPATFRPWATVAPDASAAAFLATPASSTPTGSVDSSHTTPARG